MESVTSAIFKVVLEIAKAEREARRNRTRCQELAQRARVVSNVLRDARTARNDAAAATRRTILRRLREALDDALKLVESSGRRDASLWYRITAFVESRARAARFDDEDKRINNCLVDHSAASGASIEKKIDRLAVSARDHHPGTKKQRGATGQAGQNGGKGGKRRRGKKKNAADASRPPAPPPVAHAGVRFHQNGRGCTSHHRHYHSVEEDLNSCSIM
ncbi:hypothetical protein PR202_ga22179 [Eleusine coracana subsp. coracana]|uniref:Uncharacterized protein n=1 Tax=Eleusine coracana subsp. coracana TaxID=191504 RepID=A0AAV5D3L4_ELECO|nr:hypothetical protein PR202_ga22179 [Eleusine coracana subsp. coracana]